MTLSKFMRRALASGVLAVLSAGAQAQLKVGIDLSRPMRPSTARTPSRNSPGMPRVSIRACRMP
jgi:hypothetical protein